MDPLNESDDEPTSARDVNAGKSSIQRMARTAHVNLRSNIPNYNFTCCFIKA
jgi:hypothetical protein